MGQALSNQSPKRDDIPPQRNESDQSAISSRIEAISSRIGESNYLLHGEYEHNLEVLGNLDDDSIDEFDEDRLVYVATKKFAPDDDSNTTNRRVVSSAELEVNDDFSDAFRSGDIEIPPTKRQRMIRNFVLIFKGDDNYTEVSREEILRVRVMHERFLEGSQFSFNYNSLLIIASLIAALGLGSDSTATIIASMLVSPLMGPVMGMAYGATILDFKLFRIAFVTELVSLLACIFVGAFVSICMCPLTHLVYDKMWPTDEMFVRARIANFIIGIPIAFISGLGVAVSVLDEQTSSLVGVAISASLLPPAINAGMLWATALFESEVPSRKLWKGGLISLGLTIVNIILIIVSSMIMFRVKEVSRKTFLIRQWRAMNEPNSSHSDTTPTLALSFRECTSKRKRSFGPILDWPEKYIKIWLSTTARRKALCAAWANGSRNFSQSTSRVHVAILEVR